MIQVLPPDEAGKIAAGEVVDRPAALVREFLDNAIDSGAAHIEVSLENGGAGICEVNDDGEGMSRDDLELCWQPHATSKIHSVEDLKTASTLGFRGEALAAAAAVSRLEITSCREDKAYKLTVGPGLSFPPRVENSVRTKGTTVRTLGLFDTIPARKRFLKSPGSEAALCRTVFNDKALSFPGIEFRFLSDGKLKNLLPPVSTYKERFAKLLLEDHEKLHLHEIAARGEGFNAVILIGDPELYRSDRRQQFVFANGRRIQDYALMQALEYGTRSWFPNGVHPVGALFLNIDPALADFNIHPAKREARFADPASIHHSISSSIENFFRDSAKIFINESKELAFNANLPEAYDLAEPEQRYSVVNDFVRVNSAENEIPAGADGIKYLGRAFDLFILVEKGDKLYAIDQHAAHERILYNSFLEKIPVQELLVALPIPTGSREDEKFLSESQTKLEKLGIIIKEENGSWFIEALPSGWNTGDQETITEILSLKNAGEGERWLATLSCRKAVKDGDYLDPRTALDLAGQALKLPICRCPHGRPVYFEITRTEMYKAVRRIQ